MARESKGITLVALVITIIVMLILAGVTISVIVNGGLFGQAKTAVDLQKKERVREQILADISDITADLYSKGITPNYDNIMDELEKREGYEVDKHTGEIIKDGYVFILDKDTLQLSDGEKYIAEEPIKPPTETTPTASTNFTNAKANGVIDIVWLDVNNKVIPTPASPDMCGMWKVYWDDTQNPPKEIKEFNSDGSSNAEFVLNNWYSYTAQNTSTESGGTSHWANAVTKDGTCYFVWIPRYAYKITYFGRSADANTYRNTGVANNPKGYSNIFGLVDKTSGTEKLIEGSTPTNLATDAHGNIKKVKTGAYSDYIPHPAFTFNGANKKGIWVGKYESSAVNESNTPIASPGNNTTNTARRIASQPLTNTWVTIIVSNIFTNCYNMRNSDIASGGGYGFASGTDTHMIKNIEWGAVAYLTESKYGRNGTEVNINNYCVNSAVKTGYGAYGISDGQQTTDTNIVTDTMSSGSAGQTFVYNNTKKGVLASTTGNIYGIYDMSGGASEYVAGNLTAYPLSAGTSGIFSTYYPSNISYFDFYTADATSPGINTSNYARNIGVKGDAIYETSTVGSGTTNWHNDNSNFVVSINPWFLRGRWLL